MTVNNTPERVLECWLEYVNNLEVEKVADLYDDTCILMATFSPHAITRPHQIKEYFRNLSRKRNMRVELNAKELKTMNISGNVYVMTGVYSFHYMVGDKTTAFPSRFTIILNLSKAKPIIHHHSSQVPGESS